MTRDPHCDGCKADDKLHALREQVATLTAERDAARAELEHAREALVHAADLAWGGGPRPAQSDVTERSENEHSTGGS